MRIGFIGAGKVGTAFGIYLKQKGFKIAGYFSRTRQSGSRSAANTASLYYSDLNQLIEETDIIFITATDDQIENICLQLCQTSSLRQGQIIIHMSGALPSTILSSAKAFGCHIYSLHPLLAFADIEKSVCDLPEARFCLEGDEERMYAIEEMLQVCGNKYFKLKSEQKALYHASACMLSNYLVTLVHNGLKIMESIQIANSTAFDAMLPLINCTLQNILEFGSEKALTGPISRGDINTVAKQLDAINTSSPEQLALYASLSEETIKLAMLNKLKNPSDADKLKTIIESYL
jgi:predicted short-subunit dehydrogenase-like oxidoreductase (DUF2520 family)